MILPQASKKMEQKQEYIVQIQQAQQQFTGADLIAPLQKTEVAVQALDGNGADSGSIRAR